ncbi:MAG: response regulator transcription factor [Nitrospira sp.]|nr:response regulator transcription factor [Nitrospira sp.]
MIGTSATMPTRTIAILSSQWLLCLGLQKLFESRTTFPVVVRPHQGKTSDGFPTEPRTDVFILDLETDPDAIGTIRQIREAAPTSKIVLLCGIEDQDRTREAFAYGVDGVILKVQPPEVVLAVLEALYVPTKPQAAEERNGAGVRSLGGSFTKTVEADPQSPAWPEALTEREREIIRLVGEGLSNKDIAYQLSISDSTVRHHMTNIFDKVGVPNRQKLLVHAHHVRSPPPV